MKKLDQITEILESLSDNKLVDLWNDYCDENSNADARVYEFDDQFFEDYFSNPGEAARAVFFGDVKNWNDSYVIFNGYANLETSNDVSELISLYDLANHIESNQSEYQNILGDDDTDDDI